MQDNSTYDDIIEQLIRYADGELNADENATVDKMLQEDEVLKLRYENILAAKAAIRSKGLQQRVAAIHKEYIAEKNNQQTRQAKIIKPSFGTARILMRVAAMLLFVVVGYGVYQYSTTTTDSVFNNSYLKYELPVTRSENKFTQIDSLYSAGKYTAVVQLFESSVHKTPQDYFLAAQSYLQTGNANAAVTTFKTLQQINNTATEKYFLQETDYYLAIAYIKTGDISAAQKQLALIKANKQHMFYQKANEISNLELTILKWKE